MKYSLRSLMIVVTLGPPLVAGSFMLLRAWMATYDFAFFYIVAFCIFFVVPGLLYLVHRLVVRP